MYEEKNFSTGSMVITFLVGGIIGAGLALLTAPRSGRETREKLKYMAEDAREKIKSATDEARAKIADTLRQSKERMSEGKSAIGGAIEAGKRAMEEEKQRMAGT